MPSTSLSKSRLESLLVMSPASANPEKSKQNLASYVIFFSGRIIKDRVHFDLEWMKNQGLREKYHRKHAQ